MAPRDGEHQQLRVLAEPAGERDGDLHPPVGALLDLGGEVLLELDERAVGEVVAPPQLELGLREGGARDREAQGAGERGKRKRS